jgi:TatD DNase family protein
MLIDTHCHIHEADYPLAISDVLRRAQESDVQKYICVGTTLQSSIQAIDFAAEYDKAVATIGVHPHETKDGLEGLRELASNKNVVAVGEIGLDYFYTHSPRDVQIAALETQIQLALDYDLPIIFHVRDAFRDFWPIFDAFPGIRGVLHSFTDSAENLQEALKRGLYIGVNGISTFTKSADQLAMYKSIPLSNLLLETDAPFLTPSPFRGTVNEPAFVKTIAEFHANLREISLLEIADATTANAHALFAL